MAGISWTPIREALRVGVTSCLGLDDTALTDEGATAQYPVEWVDRAASQRWTPTDGVLVDMRLTPKAKFGRDETRYVHDVGTDTFVAIRTGVRLFTVSVLVQSFSQEPDANAMDLASNLQTGWLHPTIRNALVAANVSTIDVGPAIDATYIDADGRAKSAAMVELHLATTEEWYPNGDLSGDYFNRVRASTADDSELVPAEVDVTSA